MINVEVWLMRGFLLLLVGVIISLVRHIWRDHTQENQDMRKALGERVATLEKRHGETDRVIERLDATLKNLERQFGELRASVDGVNATLTKLLTAVAGSMTLGRRKTDLFSQEPE